ncbi:MAG TPA: Wzz/FepE/Etk N-terminal domain-containing protein, partial [Bacillota bacterium]
MDQAPSVRALDDEIDLRDLILPLIENWRRIAAAVVAAALLAGGVSFFLTPTYESEIRLRIVPLRGIPDVGWSEPPAATYEAMAEAPGLQAAVAREFDPSIENPLAWFDRAVDVTVDKDAGIVTLTTRADTPAGARNLALAVADAMIARSRTANLEALRQLVELELAQVRVQAQTVEQELARTDPYIWVQEALT